MTTALTTNGLWCGRNASTALTTNGLWCQAFSLVVVEAPDVPTIIEILDTIGVPTGVSIYLANLATMPVLAGVADDSLISPRAPRICNLVGDAAIPVPEWTKNVGRLVIASPAGVVLMDLDPSPGTPEWEVMESLLAGSLAPAGIKVVMLGSSPGKPLSFMKDLIDVPGVPDGVVHSPASLSTPESPIICPSDPVSDISVPIIVDVDDLE